VFATVNPVRQLSSDVVLGGEHLLLPKASLLGELFANHRTRTGFCPERTCRTWSLPYSFASGVAHLAR